MRTSIFFAVLLSAALSLSCGHGAGVSTSFGSSSSGDFSLRVERMDGGGHLAASVEGTLEKPIVVVTAEGAEAFKGAYFYVEFPGERYHPVGVEFGDFLGGEGETVRLAVTTQSSEVPVAIAQVHPDSSSGASGSGVLAQVSFAAGATALSKAASQVPGGPENAVKDLTLVPTATEGSYFLTWHEVDVGDYNNDSAVGIQDITPLAVRFGQSVGDGDPQDSWDGIIDGNGDSIINILDVTPLASHFGNSLAGYKVFKNGMPTPLPNLEAPSDPISILRPMDYDPKGRVPYSYGVLVAVDGDEYRVACCDASGETGVLSDPAVYSSGEPPAVPTGLQAVTGEAVGVGSVYLSWNANGEPDLMGYHLFRRVEGGDTFSQIAAPGAYANSYSDSGLAPGTYEYALSAYNSLLQESEMCEPVPATPFSCPPPEPPTNLQVANTGIPAGSIRLTWTASVSTTVHHCEIHRQAPGEAGFSLLTEVPDAATTYTDSGLTMGETYAYKMRAVDDWTASSVFTPIASTSASYPPAIEIAGVVRDRTTCGPGDAVDLTVNVNTDDANVGWEASFGSFLGGSTGKSVRWSPGGSVTHQHVTLTVTCDDGFTSDSENLGMITTSLPDLGPALDFAKPSASAGSPPYRKFSTYLDDGKVITLTFDKYC